MNGIKVCTKCKTPQPTANFVKDRQKADGLRSWCNTCKREWGKPYYRANRQHIVDAVTKWRAAHPARYKEWRMLSKYKLSPDGFKQLADQQDGACAVCKVPFAITRCVVDHDHSCCAGKETCGKCVRGLLCNSCNKGLGWFKDNVAILHAAAAYIERAQ